MALGDRSVPQPLLVDVRRIAAEDSCQACGLHAHYCFVLAFVEKGWLGHRIGGVDWSVSGNQMLVIAPREMHQLHGAAADGWQLSFLPDASAPALAVPGEVIATKGEAEWSAAMWQVRASGPVFALDPDQADAWAHQIEELVREVRERPPGFAHAVSARLAVILIDIVRLAAPRLERPAATDPVVAEVFDVIDRSFGESLSLGDVAQAVARSPAHLSRLIKRSTGETVLHWIHERRMREARRLLTGTQMPVEAVASAVGYKDRSYFTRRFTRMHGMAPSFWREPGVR